MGQYHLTVNYDKREYLSPHDLGEGLKLLEQNSGYQAPPGGITSALHVLLACSNGRGGGDFPTGIVHLSENDYEPSIGNATLHGLANAIVGRWAGDRVAVVGDYSEDGDLPWDMPAEIVYSLCRGGADAVVDLVQHWGEERDSIPERIQSLRESPPEGTDDEWLQRAIGNWERRAERAEAVLDYLRTGPDLFTDITGDVRAYLEAAGFAEYHDDRGMVTRKPATNPA